MLFHEIIRQEPIYKGWSGDQKYCAVLPNGPKYLLRITPDEKSAKQERLFEILEKLVHLHIPMPSPVELGQCDGGIYTLYTWIEGTDAEETIPTLPEARQYALGLKAGEILKGIHSIAAPDEQEDWHTRFNRKTDFKIKKYEECGIRFVGDQSILEYLKNNRDSFINRPQTFQHGDYHIGNMMIENDKIVVIDFDRFDFGDPWEEFNRIVWSAQAAPLFAAGMVDGYFHYQPPREF